MRTRPRSSIARLRASAFDIPRRTVSPSMICDPTRRTGLSAVIGSWKIIAIPVPHVSRTSSRDREEISLPSNVTVPVRVAVGARRPIEARERTVLPDPDSPTIPMLSPAAMSRVTPLTACRLPRLVAKEISRFSSLSIDVTVLPVVDRVVYE